ncbi:MAG TPA: hypothetical protein VF921_16785 [Vicinamibacterales bacterium]
MTAGSDDLTDAQTRELLAQPETGMGYQVVDATLADNTTARGLAYNAELLSLDNEPRVTVPTSYRSLLETAKSASGQIKSFRVVPRTGSTTFSIARESSAVKKAGPAKDAPDENTTVGEIFKRFSAYLNDRRVLSDGSLAKGSFATTEDDAKHVKTGADAVARYALPNASSASYRFTIKPDAGTQLKRGVAAPAYAQLGGGVEVVFTDGTQPHTVTGPDKIPDN